MEERKFTEKESLELISQMISASRQRLQKGSGNPFLYYGYPSLAISVATFLITKFSGDYVWNMLWILMFIPAIVLWVKDRGEKPETTSYIDRMLTNTWKVVLMLMLPLALIFVCTGTLITGLTIGEGGIVGFSFLFSLVIPGHIINRRSSRSC